MGDERFKRQASASLHRTFIRSNKAIRLEHQLERQDAQYYIGRGFAKSV